MTAAGAAMDALIGHTRLFIELLRKLLIEYADKKVIHVICDNYPHHPLALGVHRAGEVTLDVLPRRRHRALRPGEHVVRADARAG